jgi:hypothetical protein
VSAVADRLTSLQLRVYEVMNVCQVTEAAAGEDNMAVGGTMTVAARELRAIANDLSILADEQRAAREVKS